MPSALRAMWVSTCPRVQPGSSEGRRAASSSSSGDGVEKRRWTATSAGEVGGEVVGHRADRTTGAATGLGNVVVGPPG